MLNNPFEKYGGQPLEQQKSLQLDQANEQIQDNPFAKYGGNVLNSAPQINNTESNPPPSLAKNLATYGKSAVAGAVGGVADTAALAYNLPVMGINYAMDKNIPLIPSATEAIERKIDEKTGGYTKIDPEDQWKHEALKFATQMATPGALATAAGKKGLRYIEKGLGFLGSTQYRHVAGAAAAGGATQIAKDQGASDLAAAGIGLAAGVGTSSLKSFKEGSRAHLTGQKPQNIDTKVVDAAVRRQYGKDATWESLTRAQQRKLDIHTTLANTSPMLANAEKYLEEVPFFGDRHKKKLLEHDNRFTDSVESSVNTAGNRLVSYELPRPEALGEVGKYTKEGVSFAYDTAKKEKDRLYALAHESLPQADKIRATNTLETIKNIEGRLGTKTGLSSDSYRLNKYLQDIKSNFVLENPHGNISFDTPVSELVRLKRELNDIIDWDTVSGGVKESYKSIRSSISKDIETYGKKNESWYQSFKDADAYYGKHLGSESLASDTIKAILKEEDVEKILPRLTNASDFKKLKNSLAPLPNREEIFNTIKTEKIKDLLLDTGVNKGEVGTNYKKFRDTIDAPEKASLVQELIGKEQFDKLKDLNVLAKAQIRRGNRASNKSGTAYQKWGVVSTIGFIASPLVSGSGDLLDRMGGALRNFGLIVSAAGALSYLVSNKASLNKAINAAKAIERRELAKASKWEAALEADITKEFGKGGVLALQELTKYLNDQERNP